MNCHQAQMNLSLYLYGELDFAQEELLEQHLAECPVCERALTREKTWHTLLKSEQVDVSFEFLSQCRRELKNAISPETGKNAFNFLGWDWKKALGISGAHWAISGTRWSAGIATASFFLCVGFGAARLVDRYGLPGLASDDGTLRMDLIDPSAARIRDIQPGANNTVRIVLDQFRERQIAGSIQDENVRRWLLNGTRDPVDPSIRVYSVELLSGQDGNDVRDALIHSVKNDPNTAVRLKAVEGLRGFASDPVGRSALSYVLEHDENPAVRSQAIDVLALSKNGMQLTPRVLGVLQAIAQSDHEEDYLRLRSLQLLNELQTDTVVH